MQRCAVFGTHVVPVYILTIGDAERLRVMDRTWSAVLNPGVVAPGPALTSVARCLFRGIDARAAGWTQPRRARRWRKGLLRQMVQAGLVQRLSGPSLHNLTPAEVAVALGFLQIMRDLLLSPHAYALLLEDDANLLLSDAEDRPLELQQSPAQLRAKIASLLQHAPVGWDILRLGACFSRGFTPLMRFAHQDPGQSFELGPSRFALCMHGLLVSRRTCATMLQHALPLRTTFDHELLLCAREKGLLDLDVRPHCVGQDLLLRGPAHSSIGYAKGEQLLLRLLYRWRASPAALASALVHLKQLL